MHVRFVVALTFGCCLTIYMSIAFGFIQTKRFGAVRIIDGNLAKPGQFPYQVGIFDGNEFICGGAIIDTCHIITAAHCVVPLLIGKITTPSKLMVKGGDVNLLSNKIKEFPVSEVHVNEPFDWWTESTHDNDIAILKLERSIHFKSGVLDKIKLASDTVADGTVCVVSGWGYLHENATESPILLHYMNFQVINRKECEAYFKPLIITTNQICAGDPIPGRYTAGESASTYHGDSGGPLVCGNELVGVVSFGKPSPRSGPGVYVNIASKRSWISSKINKDKFKDSCVMIVSY